MRARNLVLGLVVLAFGLFVGSTLVAPAIAGTEHFNLTNINGDDTYKIDGCRNTPFNPSVNGSGFYFRAKDAAAEISAVSGSGLDFVYTSPQPCIGNSAGTTGAAGVPSDNTWIGDYWTNNSTWNWTSSTPSSGQKLGEASMAVSGSSIDKVWIKINDDNNIPWWQGSTITPEGDFDLEAVQLHEIGHGAGFGHFGCNSGTMCGSALQFDGSGGYIKKTLTDHEEDDLDLKY